MSTILVICSWVWIAAYWTWLYRMRKRDKARIKAAEFWSAQCDEAYAKAQEAYANGDEQAFNLAEQQFKLNKKRFKEYTGT